MFHKTTCMISTYTPQWLSPTQTHTHNLWLASVRSLTLKQRNFLSFFGAFTYSSYDKNFSQLRSRSSYSTPKVHYYLVGSSLALAQLHRHESEMHWFLVLAYDR